METSLLWLLKRRMLCAAAMNSVGKILEGHEINVKTGQSTRFIAMDSLELRLESASLLYPFYLLYKGDLELGQAL